MKKVLGHDNLFKDEQSGVIINRGGSERDRYRIAKENAHRSIHHGNDIEQLKNEIGEIKSLLTQLLNK